MTRWACGYATKKAEHVTFASRFERRASNTKRLQNARAKTCDEDHATPFCDSEFVPSSQPDSQAVRTKIDEKSFENPQKWNQNQRKIDAKSILGGFWRSKPFRERAGTRLGRVRDAQKRPRDRSSGVRGGPRAFGDRPKKLPRAGPRTLPDDSGAIPERTWCTERCRARSRNDFALFLSCRAKARSLKFVRPRSVS